MSHLHTAVDALKRSRLLPIAVVAGLASSSCTSASVEPLPDPPKVEVPPTSTSVPDFSGAKLLPVDGTTTTAPLRMSPGSASITGRVVAPNGPAGGATVRIERFVEDQSVTTDVTAGADGVYRLENVLGGRYRIRAFRPPDATQTSGQLIFVAEGEKRSMDLQLEGFGGGTFISTAIAPTTPILGGTANVVVSATTAGVDGSGVARSFPAANIPLQLITAGGKAILSNNPVSTNGSGRAQWQVRCDSLAGQGLSVALPDGTQRPVNVAACTPPPPPPPPTTAPPPPPPPTTAPPATPPPRR